MNLDASTGGPDAPEESPQRPRQGIMSWFVRQARRVVVFVIGSTVLLLGIIMILGPGPAIVVIPLGLTILATEFLWARRWLNWARRQLDVLGTHAASYSRKRNDTPHDE